MQHADSAAATLAVKIEARSRGEIFESVVAGLFFFFIGGYRPVRRKNVVVTRIDNNHIVLSGAIDDLSEGIADQMARELPSMTEDAWLARWSDTESWTLGQRPRAAT